jgi:N-acetylglucosaminyldiphosphoundecaprenol N-acetyl-beta-D-mannosaminyltransferase
MKTETIDILNVPFSTLYQSEILELIKKILSQPARQFFLATPNPEMLLAAEKDPNFLKILQHTNLNIPDGNGIIWANLFLRHTERNKNAFSIYLKGLFSYIAFLFHPKNEKKRFNKAIHGSDLMRAICQDEQLSRHGIFLLGNKHGLKKDISSLTAESLRQTNPNINLVGHYDGSPADSTSLGKIISTQPEILFVGLGAPYQETWLAENLSQMPSVKLAIGVGGTFDFIAGLIPRAPYLMRKTGLEWLYRLYRQPHRINRIINAAVIFPIKVISARSKGLR